MATFSPLYTGEGSAVKMPELDNLERSVNRSGQMAIRAEEQKLSLALKDRDTFMKLMEVDPVMAISTRDQMTQTALLNKYNNKGAEIMRRDGGRLTESGRLELMKEKALLTAQQNKILANQEQWKAAKQVMARNTNGYWSVDEYQKAEQKYFKTGVFPPDALQVAAQDFATALSKSELTGTPSMKTDIQTVKDATGKTTRWATDFDTVMTEQEAIDYIPKFAISNEAYLKGILNDFSSISEKEQLDAVGDYNKDGAVDPRDIQYAQDNRKLLSNPILQWAAKNKRYQQQAMKMRPRGGATEVKERTTGGNGVSVNVAGLDMNITPATKRTGSVQYGDKTYLNTYAFPGNTTLSNLPTLGGLRFKGTSSRPNKKGNITGKLKDYIADDDMIIIEAATGIPELDIETKGLVAIPASSIQGADNLPITVNGKTTNLGAIRGGQTTSQTAVTKKPKPY